MPSALYASYLASRQQNGNGLSGTGSIPEHLDPQYQFAGWISVKRIPEVDHRIIEPSLKKEKKNSNRNGQLSGRMGLTLDEGVQGRGVAGSMGAAAAMQDPRFTYLDTQNPHLSLPACLQARFKDSKYGVIKGASMFIYENEHMRDCLGVITLPNYQISVPGEQKDSHIFSKRNPIWLKHQPSPHHGRHSTSSSDASPPTSKDYYLSMVSSVDKEELYFTLLRCSKLKPNSRSFLREIPKRDSTLFDKSAMNTLIRSIHSNEHQYQSAWLNAMLGRIFLGIYKTPQVKDMVFQKMVDKLSRVRLPNFLNDMRMKSVHLGDGVPLITRPKLLSFKPNGDLVMDMNLLYQGGFRAEVEAEAVVTVTKKIQPIKVSLVLVMTLVRLEGRLQAWIKPPPCNRIWYGFYQKPQVEMKIEPVVSDKHIKSNLIIKAIENKMLEALAETMVLPNMDDIPFSDSEGLGGIFGEEILPGDGATTPPQHLKQQHAHTVPSPNRAHSPPTRSATINLVEPVLSTPRSAIELPSDLRHRTETMTIPELYESTSSARSRPSHGDEILQANYSYDNQSRTASAQDDDPLQSSTQRPKQPADYSESHTARTLNVPGSRSTKAGEDSVSRTQSPDSAKSTTSSSRLLNRRNPGHTLEPVHGHRESLDPNSPLSYTTGVSAGSVNDSSHFPATESTRPAEDDWSQYGISEYEPSAPEGGRINSKDKKKVKEKPKASEKDVDLMSVHSKDSGDTASTYTGNTHLTDNTGQSSTLYGHSSSSNSIIDSPSSRSDKFSLSRMFNGFRKKHTKGAHSGSMLPNPTNGLGREDDQDSNSVLLEEAESANLDTEGSLYHGSADYEAGRTPTPSPGHHLSSSFQPHHRKKFESTPNLSSVLYTGERQGGSASADGAPISSADSAHSVQEEYEYVSMQRQGSPVASVYAASLFDDSHGQPSQGPSASVSKHPPLQHHPLMNFSPRLGTALRKLRNRPRAGSASSKEDLSIPPGDLTGALQQNQGVSGSDTSSQTSNDSSTTNTNNDAGARPRPASVLGSPLEDEQPSKNPNTSISAMGLQSGRPKANPSTAPLIVLQKPSPHLGHIEPPSPMYAEGMFPDGGYHERASMDDSRLLSMRHQSYSAVSVRSDRYSPNVGSLSPVLNDRLTATSGRPRRHSINHPPTASPVAYAMHHHFMTHGLGVTPTSPLRREFTRDDDDTEFSPTMTLNRGGSGNSRNRDNTDALSMRSAESHSPNDSQPHRSSTFRHILSSLGDKVKKKNVPQQGFHPSSDDPYNTVGFVGMAGIIAIGRAGTTYGTEDDPYAQAGGVEERKELQRASMDSNRPHHSQNSDGESLFRATEERKMKAGLGPLLESPTTPPTQSIMGKAIAIDVDHHKESLHARPGYIGEYPTPVRMHSMLNREAAAVRSVAEQEEEQDEEDDPPKDVDHEPSSSTRASSYSLSLDVSLSPSLPLSARVATVKSNSMPPPQTGMLPEPLPVPTSGEEIPLAMPIYIRDSGTSSDQGDFRSGSSEQTMARYEYGTMVNNPRVEEPSRDREQAAVTDRDDDGEGAVEDDGRFLHPSSKASPPNSLPGTKKSQHRNIFKRLIRRKSEDSLTAMANDPSRHSNLSSSSSSLYMSPKASQSQSSVLGTSSTSSSSFSLPFLHHHHLPHYHHHQDQQHQSQGLEQPSFDPSHPQEYLYQEHSSTQVPDHNPDLMYHQGQTPEDASIAREGSLNGARTKTRTRPRSSTIHAISLSRT
ncbi:hypothetical protein BGZ54_010481 [Gamsiella multidivaricata]|nr:hypothetical protein BGZ54_010481 [Gamsiella multidivaricata]